MPKARKKPKKGKLPTTIAGVRLGKDLRNAIGPVFRFAQHPMVNDALAAAMVASADAVLAGKKRREVSDAAFGAAVSNIKKRATKGTIGLALAVAAGEIAAHIVAAYTAAPKSPKKAIGKAESTARKTGSRDSRRQA